MSSKGASGTGLGSDPTGAVGALDEEQQRLLANLRHVAAARGQSLQDLLQGGEAEPGGRAGEGTEEAAEAGEAGQGEQENGVLGADDVGKDEDEDLVEADMGDGEGRGGASGAAGGPPEDWEGEEEEEDDEEEEEDEEWDPSRVERWYCVNCTMPNRGPDCRHCGAAKSFDPSRPLAPQPPCSPFGEGLAGTGTRGGESASTAAPNTVESVSSADAHGPSPSGAVPAAETGAPSGPAAPTAAASAGAAAADAEAGRSTGTASATVVGYDERMLLHEERVKPNPHPERPDRLRAIMGALAEQGFYPGRCTPWEPRLATDQELLMVHSAAHIDRVEATRHFELSYFTPDTYANATSTQAARLAAACCVDITVAVAQSRAKNGISLVRPPGHHAVREGSQGFCLHNNSAVAARAAQAAGARRVLIVDWDVHHGNGTQHIFENDPTILYVSLHRYEDGCFYPGTGDPLQIGQGAGKGYSVNVGWPTGGIGDKDYISAFLLVILPIAYQFQPDITIISAGFDAARGDPLGGCDVTPAGFAHMTSLLMSLAQGKLVVILEGGYNLKSISASVVEVVKVLLGEAPPALPEPVVPTPSGLLAMRQTSAALAAHWSLPLAVPLELPSPPAGGGLLPFAALFPGLVRIAAPAAAAVGRGSQVGASGGGGGGGCSLMDVTEGGGAATDGSKEVASVKEGAEALEVQGSRDGEKGGDREEAMEAETNFMDQVEGLKGEAGAAGHIRMA